MKAFKSRRRCFNDLRSRICDCFCALVGTRDGDGVRLVRTPDATPRRRATGRTDWLGQRARRESGGAAASSPLAFEALRAAEGSDWFWWFGEDQGSTWDPELDLLFRDHLRRAYVAAGLATPAELAVPVAARLRQKAS